ncbi:MAG TPA: HNH endonuclease signature motif containing protein, partial [Thermoanaerobaculia bacterium]|nr:HNH endonuclease signature motif containing protein [Thermoanaerobaculia bacterium]
AAYIGAELRQLVADRADRLCEYCLLHEEDTFFNCEVDHIISKKHGGASVADNLAYSCLFCNRSKGSDISSVVPGASCIVRFFNPRIDRWSDHFRLESDGITIAAVTEVGEATSRILRFNQGDRLLEREALRTSGRYPTEAALRRMTPSSLES